MSPKTQQIVVEELINALQDEAVARVIGSIFENKLAKLLKSFNLVKQENAVLRQDLAAANVKIDRLEAYNRKSNLIFTGIPLTSYSDATAQHRSPKEATSAVDAENSILELVNVQLGVKVTPTDISIAHRLRTKKDVKGPPPIIVRFTNMKVRDAVYKARCTLKNHIHQVFINEDLQKTTADLFRQARGLIKEHKLHGAWTAYGTLYVKTGPSTTPIRVSSADDLVGI